MTTAAYQGAEMAVNDALSGEDAVLWSKILNECLRDFRIGEYPQTYVNMIFQKWDRFKPTIIDAYNFMGIHACIQLGELAILSIPMISGPYMDKRIAEQNEALSKLPPPYKAEFWGGTQDEDGILEWNKPVHGAIALRERGSVYSCIIPPLSVPLEVGTCESEKMFLYCASAIRRGFGVARWPYGSNKIYVITREFYGENDDKFFELIKDIGESLEDFALDENRNPFLEWGRHKSKHQHHSKPISKKQNINNDILQSKLFD